MQVKTCSKCGKTKPIEMFFRIKSDSEVRHGQCKDCMSKVSKKWFSEHKEKNREYSKKWAEANPEKIKESSKRNRHQTYINHKEKVIAYGKKWTSENKERHLVWRTQYNAAYMPKYYREHPEKFQESRHRRRARITSTGDSFTAKQWRDLCSKYNNTCLCCGRNDVPMTPDHIVPISKGGSNSIENIQPLCLPCNLRKHTRTIDYRNSVYATQEA